MDIEELTALCLRRKSLQDELAQVDRVLACFAEPSETEARSPASASSPPPANGNGKRNGAKKRIRHWRCGPGKSWQLAIADFLADHPGPHSSREIAVGVGRPASHWNCMVQPLAKLIAAGLAERDGHGKYWGAQGKKGAK